MFHLKFFKICLVSILLGISAYFTCNAQDFSTKIGVGVVYPIDRTYISVDFRNKIAKHYTLMIATEISHSESNVSPKLSIDIDNFSAEFGFGWGHDFRKHSQIDHNYHTYTIGVNWNKNFTKDWGYYLGLSMYWRTVADHIGFYRGTLRLNSGVVYYF